MLEALRDEVRARATERTWSQGVALARDGRVVSQHKLVARSGDAAGEIQLEVRVPGRPTPFEVTLYVAHGDWECSCESRERACSHVVAGVLAAVAVGVVRTTDDVLRPIGAEDLSGSRLDRLPHVQFVPQSAFATLLGVTLPELAQRVPIDVRATRLPKLGGREPPRIDFDVQPDG